MCRSAYTKTNLEQDSHNEYIAGLLEGLVHAAFTFFGMDEVGLREAIGQRVTAFCAMLR